MTSGYATVLHRFASIACLSILSLLAALTGAEAETPDAPAGSIFPIVDCSGSVADRACLSGDWGGRRRELAEKGVQGRLEWTNALQSVMDGGTSGTETRLGGALDLIVSVDFDQMGVIPGGALFFRAESRYGRSINGRTGQVLPANTDAFAPITTEPDEDVVGLSNILYQQFLSETFGLMIGKFDNMEGDFNEFASGRGTSQFLNANFVFTPVTLLQPYSSLGVFAVWAPSDRILMWSGVYNTTDSSTDHGFSDIGDGSSWFGEIYFQHGLEGVPPGGIAIGGILDWDNRFVDLRRTRISLGPTGAVLTPETASQGWSAYGSLWQYLWVEGEAPRIVDIQNHEVDLQGIGFFLRAGGADKDVNPIEWTVSGGLGGRGLVPNRDDDVFGLGYFYTHVQERRLTTFLGLDDHTRGFEAYYRISITPAVQVTFDYQALESALDQVDTAHVGQLRAHLEF